MLKFSMPSYEKLTENETKQALRDYTRPVSSYI